VGGRGVVEQLGQRAHHVVVVVEDLVVVARRAAMAANEDGLRAIVGGYTYEGWRRRCANTPGPGHEEQALMPDPTVPNPRGEGLAQVARRLADVWAQLDQLDERLAGIDDLTARDECMAWSQDARVAIDRGPGRAAGGWAARRLYGRRRCWSLPA
jgi:hypothetical protein